jgi:hypothetical protein
MPVKSTLTPFPLAIAALSALVAACTSVPQIRAYLFHGPQTVLVEFVAAAKACGYQDIEMTRASHLEPIVVMNIPTKPTPEFQCAWKWALEHQADGLTNRLPAED